jgi:ribonucleotide monophosphatase NagD (HAD superfamily)
MGLPRSAAKHMVVVGDDPALEMRMANAGALSVGMATGIMAKATRCPSATGPPCCSTA